MIKNRFCLAIGIVLLFSVHALQIVSGKGMIGIELIKILFLYFIALANIYHGLEGV